MMKLESVTLRNFMPYRGEHSLQFPTDDDRNVLIVFGDNMRGKTSLLNSVRWALYGQAMGRHSREIPIINIVNKEAIKIDDWRVEVHLKFNANGHSYDLRRVADRRNPDRSPISSDDFSMNVYLRKDGTPLQGDMIDIEINNIAPEAVSRFFLFDGELLQEYEALLIEDSTQGKQIKDSIEKVLGVPTLVNGRSDIRTISKKAQKQQSQDLRHIKGLEAQAERSDALISAIDSLERDISDLEKRIGDVNTERVSLEDEIEAAQSVLDAQAKLTAKKDRRDELIADSETKQGEKLDLLSVAWKDLLFVRIDTLKAQLVEKQQTLLEQIKSNTTLENETHNLQTLLDESECPTCGMELTQERRDEIAQRLVAAEERLAKVAQLSDSQADIAGELSKLAPFKNHGVLGQLQSITKDLAKNEVTLTQVENDIEVLREEIEGHDTAELARKRSLMKELGREEDRLSISLDKQKSDLKTKSDEQAVAQKAIEGLTKDRTQRSTQKVSLCSDLEALFDQSIEKLRDKLRVEVEHIANSAFSKMTTQEAYRGLEINPNYGLNILDSAGRKVTVRSAGAEQIVALSLIDGLNRTGRQAGPVLMDTPFGRLDQKHRNNVLTYLPSVTSQFMLLVHSGEIRRETDLEVISHKIGAVYEIVEISETESKLERISL
jgi:DNA sulfur modification protein DndD